jgi:hypothetical protein
VLRQSIKHTPRTEKHENSGNEFKLSRWLSKKTGVFCQALIKHGAPRAIALLTEAQTLIEPS